MFSTGALVCSKVDSRRLKCEQHGEFCLIDAYVITFIHLILCSFGTLYSNYLIVIKFRWEEIFDSEQIQMRRQSGSSTREDEAAGSNNLF